jgi:hypothetical protein
MRVRRVGESRRRFGTCEVGAGRVGTPWARQNKGTLGVMIGKFGKESGHDKSGGLPKKTVSQN